MRSERFLAVLPCEKPRNRVAIDTGRAGSSRQRDRSFEGRTAPLSGERQLAFTSFAGALLFRRLEGHGGFVFTRGDRAPAFGRQGHLYPSTHREHHT